MRILVVSETPNGGEEQATKLLVQSLGSFDIHIFHYQISSLQKTSSFSYYWWIIRSIFLATKTALTYRQSEVFYTTTFTALIGGILARPFTHQCLCFHYHGSRLPHPPSPDLSPFRWTTQWLKYSVTKHLHRFSWQKTDLFCVPSQKVLKTLRKEFPVLGKKQLIVPNGVDSKNFFVISKAEQKQLRKKYHIPQSSFVCLLIGRSNPDKNWLESLDVLSLLKKKFDLPLGVLVATPQHGNNKDYLKRFLTGLEQRKLPFLHFEGHNPVAELYQMSNFALSYSKTEVFPLTLLEAASCGIPFFSIKNKVVETYLKSIDSDLILPIAADQAATQMVCCLKKKSLSQKLQQFAQQHSWETASSTLYQALQLQLTNDHSP